jgi:4-oxalocrotonate tautomerase
MPIIEITLAEGRPPEQVRALMGEVHRAVQEVFDEPGLPIRIIVREVPPEHWLSDGSTLAERARATATTEGEGG